MPRPRLDPASLRAYAQRDWSAVDAATRSARAAESPDERMRRGAALFEAARQTRPGWPTDADRRADLDHHLRLRALLDQAPDVGRR